MPAPAGPRTNRRRQDGAARRGRAASCRSVSSGHASIRGRGVGVSRVWLPSRAVAAEHALGVGELAAGQHEEAGRAQELARPSRSDAGGPVAALVDLGLLLFLVLLLVLELGARGPLLKQDVEGLLDVVGVELLVEVDDVFFLLRRLGRGLGRLRDDHLGGLALLLLLLLLFLVLDRDALVEVVVLQVLVFELVLVDGVLVVLLLLLLPLL